MVYKNYIESIDAFLAAAQGYLDENGDLINGTFSNDNVLDFNGIYQTALQMREELDNLETEKRILEDDLYYLEGDLGKLEQQNEELTKENLEMEREILEMRKS